MAKNKYKEWLTDDGLTLLRGWARRGLTDEQIAKKMGVSPRTLYRWKTSYSPICQALKKSKAVCDDEIEESLYKSASGYFVDETKTYIDELPDGTVKKHKEVFKKWIPPQTAAQIFWLKNRRPDDWREHRKPKEQNDNEVIKKFIESEMSE